MTSTALKAIENELVASITGALQRQAFTNRGTLPPFRLSGTAQSLVAALLAGDADQARAGALGRSLSREGLSLASLIESQTAAMQTIARLLPADQLEAAITTASQRLGALFTGHASAENEQIEQQRAEIERAFLSTVNDQREAEAQLRSAIREMSTPIIPIYEGMLVLPLVGAIDSRRATEITERLLEAIAAHQAEMVIIDVTGVPVMDTSTANHLLLTTRAANLLGSQIILVGMGAEIAQTVVQLGVELHGLITLASLRDGLTYALARQGLGIEPLRQPAQARRVGALA